MSGPATNCWPATSNSIVDSRVLPVCRHDPLLYIYLVSPLTRSTRQSRPTKAHSSSKPEICEPNTPYCLLQQSTDCSWDVPYLQKVLLLYLHFVPVETVFCATKARSSVRFRVPVQASPRGVRARGGHCEVERGGKWREHPDVYVHLG